MSIDQLVEENITNGHLGCNITCNLTFILTWSMAEKEMQVRPPFSLAQIQRTRNLYPHLASFRYKDLSHKVKTFSPCIISSYHSSKETCVSFRGERDAPSSAAELLRMRLAHWRITKGEEEAVMSPSDF